MARKTKVSETPADTAKEGEIEMTNEAQEIEMNNVIESSDVELEEQEMTNEVQETEKDNEEQETDLNETSDELSVFSTLNDFNVEQLKGVISFCQERLEELQRKEVEALESEMRAIQEKLLALKGGYTIHSGSTRKYKGIRNPNNPAEVYITGKQPEWLKTLAQDSGKTVDQLREESNLEIVK